jgi:hypothetical protein
LNCSRHYRVAVAFVDLPNSLSAALKLVASLSAGPVPHENLGQLPFILADQNSHLTRILAWSGGPEPDFCVRNAVGLRRLGILIGVAAVVCVVAIWEGASTRVKQAVANVGAKTLTLGDFESMNEHIPVVTNVRPQGRHACPADVQESKLEYGPSWSRVFLWPRFYYEALIEQGGGTENADWTASGRRRPRGAQRAGAPRFASVPPAHLTGDSQIVY